LLYRGGFAAFAFVTAIAVVASTEAGPLAALLDRSALRLIGRVSYGIYLWHWPVIVLVTAHTAPVSGLELLALRLSLIAAATAASWVLIERPYKRVTVRRAVRLAPLGIAAATVSVLSLPAAQVA